MTKTRKVSPSQWYQYYREHNKGHKIKHTKETIRVTQKIPNFLKQLKVFAKRDILSKISDKQYLSINLLQAPLLALFMTFLVRYYATVEVDNPVYTFFQNDNIPVYFFMSIIVALFMGLTVSAEEIFRDRKIRKRESFLHLSKGSYLLSKILILFTISAIQTASFVLVGNTVLGLHGMGISFWLILFSSSCFSNMLGLNISATFNSAVTIYILIPILLIPQLLLSGVVINFDKFNPMVTTMDGVPAVGEVMASRWAFEAALVTQYKDNPYEKQFYDLDKRMADAEYKKLYYLPRLESELSFVFNNMRFKLNSNKADEMRNSLSVLRNELQNELQIVGEDKFKRFDRLVIERFDSATFNETDRFIGALKKFYVNRYVKAEQEMEALTYELTNTPEKKKQLDSLRMEYQNEAIISALRNNNTEFRVINIDNKLARKIDPIYFTDHKPANLFDFRANFYVPVKHFLGKHFDTLYFNLSMIWFMCLLLFISLYFDLLQRFVKVLTEKRKRSSPQF